MHPRGTIGAAAGPVDVEDLIREHRVIPVADRHRAGPLRVEPRPRHPDHPTTRPDGQIAATPVDEGVDQFGSTFSFGEVRRPLEDLVSVSSTRVWRRNSTSSLRSCDVKPSRSPALISARATQFR
jgi:hypothetical protein